MTDSPDYASASLPRVRSLARAAAFLLICAAVALLLSFDVVYASLQRALSAVEPQIAGHPLSAPSRFVLFAALSAILAFFSSALLLPAAVFTWGRRSRSHCCGSVGCWVALYLCARSWVTHDSRGKRRGASNQIDFYLQRTPDEVTFALVLLLCLALPSEIPGYLCGYLAFACERTSRAGHGRAAVCDGGRRAG